MFRRRGDVLEVLLAHPGGPFWAKKDLGAWTIPKGEMAKSEDELATARREFEEETGIRPEGPFLPLGCVEQRAGKLVYAWAFERDCDPATIRSNSVRVPWPPGSGQWRTFPEVDRAEWFGLDEARQRINPGQVPLLSALEAMLAGPGAPPST
jgi:predicted NUDIX family NTP pyrophosphohydrolase